jgi:hypothetical protein
MHISTLSPDVSRIGMKRVLRRQDFKLRGQYEEKENYGESDI